MLSRRFAIRILVVAVLATVLSPFYGQSEAASATAKPSFGSRVKNTLGKAIGHARVEKMSQKVTGPGKTPEDRLNSDKKMMTARIKDAKL
ncbi:hypothetical protein H4R34_002219 [Dimargaris verticillata]|uniref:Uncharacterized protein n=1 Tax=Dimargaris verticillata TaxID=2761393 RepID=A0A9W8EDS2_9FUNG|nr:hypothetical protein H4R34_002219 [Dimargaris verticillata]